MKSNVTKFLLTGIGLGLLSGMVLTASAAPSDALWEYETEADAAGDTVYQFEEVSMTLPADWNGKYQLDVQNADATPEGSVAVYHTASRDAFSKLYGTDSSGGCLFTLTCSTDYSFETLPDYEIIGDGNGRVYYVSLPTDVQGYSDDKDIWKEWLSLYNEVDWVIRHMTITNPGSGVSGYSTMEASTAVNIRSAASTKSTAMGVVPKGGRVTVTGAAANGWVPIKYNNLEGYIYQQYLIPPSASESTGQTGSSDRTETTASDSAAAEPSSDAQTEKNTDSSYGANPQLFSVSGTVLSVDGHSLYLCEDDGSSSVWQLNKINLDAIRNRLVAGAHIDMSYDKDTLEASNITFRD